MASLSNINGLFDVHSTGAILFSTSHGTSGQILKSNGNAAPTWVDASTVIGGPYLPLSGGTLTGNLDINGSNSLTVGGVLNGTSATFSGLVSGITPTAAANFATKAYVDAQPQGDLTSITLGNGLTGSNLSGPIPDVLMSGSYTGTFTATSLASDSFLNNAGNLLFSAGNTTTGASRSLNLRTISPTNDPSSVDITDATGITWGQRTDSQPYYIIYPKKENWNSSGNYSKLTLAWHTGIKIGANDAYGGTRFYDDSPDISGAAVILNVGVGNTNVGVVNALTVGTTINAGGDIKTTGAAIGTTQADGDYLSKLYSSASDGYMALYTGQATPIEQVRISSYGPSYIVTGTSGGFGLGSSVTTGGFNVNWTFAGSYYNMSNNDSGNFKYTNPNGRLLTSNGTGWVADGRDPILTLSSAGNGGATTVGYSVGLNLYSNTATNNTYSPLICFSNLSNSGNYATAYAAIGGKKVGAGTDSNWSTGELHFWTAGPTGSGSASYMQQASAMMIDDAGKVGIGTNTPAEKLEVAGNIRMFSAGYPLIDMGITTSNYFRLIHDNPNDVFKIGKNGAGTLNITGSGNVGIGNSPASDAKLEVWNGNLRVRGDQNAVIQLTNVAGNTKSQLGNAGNEGDLSLYTSGNIKTVYLSSYYDSYINPAGGSVGIGTDSPSGPFHVKVGTSTPLIVASSSYCNNVGIRTTTPTASLQVKGNVSYSYNNYTNVATTWVNVFNMASYPTGLYQVSIIKKTNASAYITAIIKWDATASASTAGTIVNTITSNQLGVSFNGSTTLQSISALATGTLMSANLQCLVTNEDFCS